VCLPNSVLAFPDPEGFQTTHDNNLWHPCPINFGLTELWNGETITRAMNLGVPWSRSDVADFGTALLKAHDMWAKGSPRGETVEGEVLRNKVCDLLRGGDSMVDVARILDLPWKTIARALTNNVPTPVWNWSEHDWLRVEGIIYDSFPNHGDKALAAMLGPDVTWRVVASLAEWYGVTVNQNGQERLTAMQAALRGGMHPVDACAHFTTLGYACTKEQMYMMRKRLSANGEVSPVLPQRAVIV